MDARNDFVKPDHWVFSKCISVIRYNHACGPSVDATGPDVSKMVNAFVVIGCTSTRPMLSFSMNSLVICLSQIIRR